MKWAPIFFLYKDCLAPSFNVVDVLQGKTFEHEHYINICRYKNRLIYVQRYYIITEKNTDTGFVYSLMSATIQFSQKHFIFEMMYSLKLCNQNLTIYCCIFFFLQIPWEAHRKIKDMYSQSWLDFGWAFKIFFI